MARATITRPKVLLADEPTGALHTSQGEMIMDLLGELHRDGATIVMVTHNSTNAQRADRQRQPAPDTTTPRRPCRSTGRSPSEGAAGHW